MRPGDLFESYGRALVRHRALVALILVLFSVAAAAGIAWRLDRDGLPVDFTPQALFMDDGPEFNRLAEIEAQFGREDNTLVFLLEGPLDTAEGWEWMADLHKRVGEHPQVERVDSLFSASVTEASEGMITVRSLADLGPKEALRRARTDPVLAGLLVSPDGQRTVIRARLDPTLERIPEVAPVVHALKDLAEATDQPPGARVDVVGVPYIRTDVVDLMTAEQQGFFPIVGLVFAIASVLLFRRLQLGLAPLVAVGVGVLWAMSTLLVSGATLNILSILTPTIVLVIGAADGIHLVARFREELARGGGREAAMGRTLRHMMVACFLTTFTTAAGFASLLVANTAVINAFGRHCAWAVMVAFAAVILVLPTWLAFVPVDRVQPKRAGPQGGRGRWALGKLDDLVRQRPVSVLVACLVVAGGAAALGSGVQTNSHILEMYDADHPTRAAMARAEQGLGGVIPVFVHIETGPDGVTEPHFLRALAAVEADAKAMEGVGWTTSLAAYVGQVHQMLTGEPGLPDTRAGVAQELLVAELSGDAPLDGVVTPERDRTRILALCNSVSGRVFVDMQAALEASAAKHFAGQDVRIDVTGDGVLASAGLDGLISDLLNSVGLVFLVILGTMLVLLRDPRLALIAAVPNLVPLVFTLATLRLMGVDLQTSNVMSFTVAIGMAVDDTIHFVVRYKEERAAGHTTDRAMRNTYMGAGGAIVLTSALLVLGFGVLIFSEVTSPRQFGILTGTTMVAALLGDLLLLPALLHLFDRGRGR